MVYRSFLTGRVLLAWVFVAVCPAASIHLSGVVQNQASQSVPGATVVHTPSMLADTTDSQGAFKIEGEWAGVRAPQSIKDPRGIIRFSNSRITVSDGRLNMKRIAVYSMLGKVLAKRQLAATKLELPIPHARAMYIVEALSGSTRLSVPVLVTGSFNVPRIAVAAMENRLGFPKAASPGPVVAYLRASKEGYFDGYVTVRGDTGSGLAPVVQDNSSFANLPAYKNPSFPVDIRVKNLVEQLTLEEKISQLKNTTVGIPRLGIPAYDWWNEGLHGVARAGLATSFPQAIGLAATWDPDLMFRIATAISDEARAKHHDFTRRHDGASDIYYGLTFWSPNINIFRDPRWGRGHETYGEDPYLTSRMGVAFVRGMQGDDPNYLKVAATPKHFAVHSGPEATRWGFPAVAAERDIRETYLPAFRACVEEGNAKSIMCAYNKVNGEFACKNTYLMQDILRGQWGFRGYITSDCGADMLLASGCDIECGDGSKAPSTTPVPVLDTALSRLCTARFMLGMFDPPSMVPYASIPMSVVDCSDHRALALQAARESIVLLKNQGNLLPLGKNITVALIGPHADWGQVFLANYHGDPSHIVTILQGVKTKITDASKVLYGRGCGVTEAIPAELDSAIAKAHRADVVIAALGLASESVSPVLEGEGGDRTSLGLPLAQQQLLERLVATGRPVVLALVNGGALSLPWAKDNVEAIVETWYPGQEGGQGVADVIFGDYNPAGRLPVTVYASESDIPPIEDYDMTKGRTYRYFAGEPLFPFGYGLSYTTFRYSALNIVPSSGTGTDTFTVSATVENTGTVAGDEVAQVYVSDSAASAPVPLCELMGFRRISLAPGAKETVVFKIVPYQLSLIDDQNKRAVEPGRFLVTVSGGQPGPMAASNVLSGGFDIMGTSVQIAE